MSGVNELNSNLEWEEFDEPHQKGNPFFPVPKERIPLKHKGHRYQVWETDAYGMPVLMAEFTARNDKLAQKLLPDVVAIRLNETKGEAKQYLRMYQGQVSLMNIDTLKSLPVSKETFLQHQMKKLKKIF